VFVQYFFTGIEVMTNICRRNAFWSSKCGCHA